MLCKILPSRFVFTMIAILYGVALSASAASQPIIIDHNCVKLDEIPQAWIQKAKEKLVVAYGHTSHGSQLVTGMQGLVKFKGNLYSFNATGKDGALKFHDRAFSNQRHDLGHKGDLRWAQLTRTYLDNPEHKDVNVVIWSWCGGCSDNTKEGMDAYLNEMAKLEKEYPKVRFVYMTGHLDGSGLEGNLHVRNEQIREFCRKNGKILFDFEDIESYDPDGKYFGDKYPNDACDYRDGEKRGNWAKEWQETHEEGKDWYRCPSAHSQPLNANMKAYATWWMLARIAGWPGKNGKNTPAAMTLDELRKLIEKAKELQKEGNDLQAYVAFRRAVRAAADMDDLDPELEKTIRAIRMKTLRSLEKNPAVATEKKAFRKIDKALESAKKNLESIAKDYPDSPSGKRAAKLLKAMQED